MKGSCPSATHILEGQVSFLSGSPSRCLPSGRVEPCEILSPTQRLPFVTQRSTHGATLWRSQGVVPPPSWASGRDSRAEKGETKRYTFVVVLCLFILNPQRNWAVSKSKQASFPSPIPELGVSWGLPREAAPRSAATLCSAPTHRMVCVLDTALETD